MIKMVKIKWIKAKLSKTLHILTIKDNLKSFELVNVINNNKERERKSACGQFLNNTYRYLKKENDPYVSLSMYIYIRMSGHSFNSIRTHKENKRRIVAGRIFKKIFYLFYSIHFKIAEEIALFCIYLFIYSSTMNVYECTFLYLFI